MVMFSHCALLWKGLFKSRDFFFFPRTPIAEKYQISCIHSFLLFHDVFRFFSSVEHWNSTLKLKHVRRINRAHSCRLPDCRLLPFLSLNINCIGNVIFLWTSKSVVSTEFILQCRQILDFLLGVRKGFVALVPLCSSSVLCRQQHWYPRPCTRPSEHHHPKR